MRQLLSPDDFAAAAKSKAIDDIGVYRLAPTSVDLTEADSRVVRYIFSTGAVARDNHTVNQNGWNTEGFDVNPVFLWAHDMDAPPIGKVIEKSVRGGVLAGAVKYIEPDISPFAEMIFQMVRGGYLNAVSTSWLPIEWKWSTDKSRVGGVDFIRQDLLEISQVSVPAQINAIATARAAGIDTGPMFRWAEKTLDCGGMIMVARSELETLRREAKMPKVANPKARSITGNTLVRGLYSVSNLASLLASLNWLKEDVEWEAEIEADGSDIPARLTEILKELGQVLVDMTVEEVRELIGDEDVEIVSDDAIVDVIDQSAKTPAQRLIAKLGCLSRKKSSETVHLQVDVAPLQAALEAMERRFTNFTRAGKVLSAANVESLSNAMEYHRQMGECIQGVLDAANNEDDEAVEQHSPSPDTSIDARKREAEFLELTAR